MKKGPARYQVGDLLLDASQVHIPVFGTQTDRFGPLPNLDIPPPGSYETAEAFKSLVKKGKLEKVGVMSSQSHRQLYESKFIFFIF